MSLEFCKYCKASLNKIIDAKKETVHYICQNCGTDIEIDFGQIIYQLYQDYDFKGVNFRNVHKKKVWTNLRNFTRINGTELIFLNQFRRN